MSSTHRPVREGEMDVFITPEWATAAIIPYLPSGLGLSSEDKFRVLEPCCGGGDILNVLARNPNYKLTGIDIQLPADKKKLAGLKRVAALQQHDFLDWYPTGLLYDLIVTNPPYNQALEFLEHSFDVLQPGGVVWLLLRIGFLESADRQDFISNHTPDVYVLPQRPSFYGGLPHHHGEAEKRRYCERPSCTDSACYAWMAFHNIHGRTAGTVRVLPLREQVAALDPLPEMTEEELEALAF